MVIILSLLFSASFSSFIAVALEYAVEMTYPLPEGTSAGLLSVVSMVSVLRWLIHRQ